MGAKVSGKVRLLKGLPALGAEIIAYRWHSSHPFYPVWFAMRVIGAILNLVL